ncbi:MAG: tRNA (adenosine(37)-N6)-dimethylallyltransferase MiaA [Flavobacteriales bacterium]
MSAKQNKTLLTILGPTAVGKTAFAIEVAGHFNTEIISADSRQFYKQLNIGVARPTMLEMEQVKHHFIAHIDLHEEYSAGSYARDALTTLNKLFTKHDVVVCTGGSMLFIDALLFGFDELPADKNIRHELKQQWELNGIEWLQQELLRRDETHYSHVDIRNPHRLIRALEVCIATGKKYSDLRSGEHALRNFHTVKVGLNMQRSLLYKRINQRVDEMMRQGLMQEAEQLMPLRHLNALNTVGYKELFAYIDGSCTLHEATEKIKQHTRNFAKRQLTWWRADTEINWMDITTRPPDLAFVKALAE